MYLKCRHIIPAVLLVHLIFVSFAQEMRFTSLDMTSGLSHNSALCITQDHNGSIWIGTRDGLNRFDGVDFVVYKRNFNDQTTISNNQINCIYAAFNKKLWVGTADGLNLYDHITGQFTRFILPVISDDSNPQYIWSILEASDNTIWVGTSNGLYLVDGSRTEAVPILIHQEPANNSNTVIRIFEDSDRQIWFGTRNGLFRLSGDRFIRYYIDRKLEENETRFEIRDIQQSSNGMYRIGTEGHGMIAFTLANDSVQVMSWITTSNSRLVSDHVRKIFFNNEEELWIGTLDGLSVYNPGNHHFRNFLYSPDDPDGINNSSIRDVFRDSQGGIWLATYAGGINYYHPQNNLFEKRYRLKTSGGDMRIKVVTALMADDRGHLWIGTEADGLLQCTVQNDSVIYCFNTSNSGISSNNIKSIVAGDADHIWIGTFNGLTRLHTKTGTFTNFRNDQDNSNSINNNQVHALYYEEDGQLWIGTNGGGVQLYDPERDLFQDLPGLENRNINSIYKDSRNRIWIGSQSGVSALRDTGHTLIDLRSDYGFLPDEATYVNFISEDSYGNIWIGTQWNGLFLIRESDAFWFNKDNGLIDNTVNALLQGDENQFWITTNQGLSRISYLEDADRLPSIESKSFSIKQGLQGFQFYPRSALKLPSGVLSFGGINGFNRFHPDEISEHDFFPAIILTQFRLKYQQITPHDEYSPLSKSINEVDHLTLNYDQRDFSIFFTGINFINQEETCYRYMVSGLDNSWINLGNQRFINFTYFPVGTHEIRIQASTNPERWDDTWRSLKITVLPPWWKTQWAFVVYAMVLTMLLLLFFIVSQRWAKIKNQLEMEHFQREKENELHQAKLKFFTDVSHELRTPLTLILAPLENLIVQSDFPNRFRNQLIQIQRSGYRMMQLINQVLDLRKLETGHEELSVARGNIIRFFREISLAFREIAVSRNLQFEFKPHQNEYGLWFDRDKLEIILNNLLSNAFKFSIDNGKVQLTTLEVKGSEIEKATAGIDPDSSYLRICVINQGETMVQGEMDHIYKRYFSKKGFLKGFVSNTGVGLELTKRMVELHKGIITVESSRDASANCGKTIFSLFLPVNSDVYSAAEMDTTFRNSEDPSLYRKEILKSELSLNVKDAETEINDLPGKRFMEKILIIEDNAEVRHFIRGLFEDKYQVFESENGVTGFHTAVEISPDLIISDVMMPVMDGIELCKKIKTDLRTSHIPVILLTARTAVTFKYEGIETGADEYITKPFSAQYLLLRVSNLIHQRHLIREHFKRETLCDPGSVTVTSIDEKLLKKAVDYITGNISSPSISVTKVSKHIGLSRVHFYRKIKSLTGQTAVEFIRGVRLKRAASLLEQEKLTVKEAQNMVGFENAEYFRRCFKRQFGVNPSEYSAGITRTVGYGLAP